MPEPDPDPSQAPALGDIVREFRKALGSVADDFKDAFQKVFDDVEYQVDKQVGRQLAKHPDLYAELKRGVKQFKRTVDKASKDLKLD